MPFDKHDPKGVLKNFCNQHNNTWAFAHCNNLEEDIYIRLIYLYEVKAKIPKRKKETQRAIKARDMAHETFIQGKAPI